MLTRLRVNPFRSLLVAMLVISLISITMLAMIARVVYVNSLEQVEDTLIHNKMQETSSFANLFKRDIGMVHTQMYDLMSNYLVSTLHLRFESQPPDTRLANEIRALQSSLLSKQNSLSILDAITIYYPGTQRQVTASSVRTYPDEEASHLSELMSDSENGRAFLNDSLVFWQASPYRYDMKYEDTAILITGVVSGDSVYKYLRSYMTEGAASHFAVYVNIHEAVYPLAVTSDIFHQIELDPQWSESGEGFYAHMKYDDDHYLITGVYSDEDEMTFYQMTPLDSILLPLSTYKQRMLIWLLVIVALSIGLTVLMYLMIYRPVAHARRTFQKMKYGNLGTRLGKAWHIEFQDMYRQFDNMSDHIQDLIEREYELSLLGAKAELKQLQYQINPHFLYNTYFILCGLMQEEEYEQAQLLAETMGRFLRYITNANKEEVTLHEEIEHARVYAQIQQMRYSKRVRVYFGECPESGKDLKVSRLILQPLIENAFEHGMKSRMSDGIISIGIACDSDGVVIAVEDNGEGLTEARLLGLREMLAGKQQEGQDSVALYNIHRRLRMTYGPGSGLDVSRSALGGLCCRLIIDRREE